MITDYCNNTIGDIIGRELNGKLNENMILILLYENYNSYVNSENRDITLGLTTRELADILELSQSTIATAVGRLREYGYVTHSKGMPVKITEIGRLLAMESLKHHRLLEVLLVEALDMDHEQAHLESFRFMMTASCDLIKMIDKRYGQPATCPGGKPIPNVDPDEFRIETKHIPTKMVR